MVVNLDWNLVVSFNRNRWSIYAGIRWSISPFFPYNLLSPKTLDFIPVSEVLEAWERDYKKMREEMIYQQDAPTFYEILEQLKFIKNKINQQDWNLGKTYPNP